MITFSCPHCQQTLNVPETSAGKKGKCPQCGNILDIPLSSPAEAYAPPPPPAPAAAHSDYPEPKPSRYVDEPLVEPVGGPGMKQSMEMAIPSLILGAVGMITSPAAPSVKVYNSLASVILGLGSLGVSGFALALAILALMKVMSERRPPFWFVLSAVVLSGTAVFVSLFTFIGSFSVPTMVR